VTESSTRSPSSVNPQADQDALPGPARSHRNERRVEEQRHQLSLAMLVLLERLSPEQRAVLLLHDVFGYDSAEIAAIVGKSEANVRQLATRARKHVEQRRPRFQTTREQRRAGRAVLGSRRAGRSRRARGAARCRRAADRRRRAARLRRSRARCADATVSRAR
jgi:predicted RNA polymerase sigma factor